MINPFESIVPRNDEVMVNEAFLKDLAVKIKESIKTKRLVILEGDYGSGKSLYMNRLFKRLTTKKEMIEFSDMTPSVLEEKVPVKNKSLFINNFDLVHGLSPDLLNRFTKAMIKLLDEEVIILIACRRDTVNFLFNFNPLLHGRAQKFKIPPLSFEEVRELVLNRLNEARESKSDDLTPFTEKELRLIYRKSSGNPRLMLLLLSPLYAQRMMLKE